MKLIFLLLPRPRCGCYSIALSMRLCSTGLFLSCVYVTGRYNFKPEDMSVRNDMVIKWIAYVLKTLARDREIVGSKPAWYLCCFII